MQMGFYFFIGAAVYFLPSWIGSEKRNRVSIFLLNLLLGWSIIGWVVALVWATTKEESPSTPASPPQPSADATVYPSPALPADPGVRANRLKDLRDRGVITQEEFMEQIGKL